MEHWQRFLPSLEHAATCSTRSPARKKRATKSNTEFEQHKLVLLFHPL